MYDLERIWKQLDEESGRSRQAEISRLQRDPNLDRMYMISEGSDDVVAEAYERKHNRNSRR